MTFAAKSHEAIEAAQNMREQLDRFIEAETKRAAAILEGNY